MHIHRLFPALLAVVLISTAAHAGEYVLTLQHNQFTPKELTIPAHEKIKLTVRNLDATPAEFESYELNREKVVSAGGQIILYIGPLDTGRYGYFDDFHRATTTGTIIAK